MQKINIHQKIQSPCSHVFLSISNTSSDSIDLQDALFHNGTPLSLFIMILKNEQFKHPHPQNVEKREYFEDLQKINPPFLYFGSI